MKRYFNIAGPCLPDEHYMVPSEHRCKGVRELIDQKQYFVIHAARQTGKTTLLLDLVNLLNREGKYHALYCTLESVQGIIEPEKGIPAIMSVIGSEIKYNSFISVKEYSHPLNSARFNVELKESLSDYCLKLDQTACDFF